MELKNFLKPVEEKLQLCEEYFSFFQKHIKSTKYIRFKPTSIFNSSSIIQKNDDNRFEEVQILYKKVYIEILNVQKYYRLVLQMRKEISYHLPFRLILEIFDFYRMKTNSPRITDFYGYFFLDRTRKIFQVFRSSTVSQIGKVNPIAELPSRMYGIHVRRGLNVRRFRVKSVVLEDCILPKKYDESFYEGIETLMIKSYHKAYSNVKLFPLRCKNVKCLFFCWNSHSLNSSQQVFNPGYFKNLEKLRTIYDYSGVLSSRNWKFDYFKNLKVVKLKIRKPIESNQINSLLDCCLNLKRFFLKNTLSRSLVIPELYLFLRKGKSLKSLSLTGCKCNDWGKLNLIRDIERKNLKLLVFQNVDQSSMTIPLFLFRFICQKCSNLEFFNFGLEEVNNEWFVENINHLNKLKYMSLSSVNMENISKKVFEIGIENLTSFFLKGLTNLGECVSFKNINKIEAVIFNKWYDNDNEKYRACGISPSLINSFYRSTGCLRKITVVKVSKKCKNWYKMFMIKSLEYIRIESIGSELLQDYCIKEEELTKSLKDLEFKKNFQIDDDCKIVEIHLRQTGNLPWFLFHELLKCRRLEILSISNVNFFRTILMEKIVEFEYFIIRNIDSFPNLKELEMNATLSKGWKHSFTYQDFLKDSVQSRLLCNLILKVERENGIKHSKSICSVGRFLSKLLGTRSLFFPYITESIENHQRVVDCFKKAKSLVFYERQKDLSRKIVVKIIQQFYIFDMFHQLKLEDLNIKDLFGYFKGDESRTCYQIFASLSSLGIPLPKDIGKFKFYYLEFHRFFDSNDLVNHKYGMPEKLKILQTHSFFQNPNYQCMGNLKCANFEFCNITNEFFRPFIEITKETLEELSILKCRLKDEDYEVIIKFSDWKKLRKFLITGFSSTENLEKLRVLRERYEFLKFDAGFGI